MANSIAVTAQHCLNSLGREFSLRYVSFPSHCSDSNSSHVHPPFPLTPIIMYMEIQIKIIILNDFALNIKTISLVGSRFSVGSVSFIFFPSDSGSYMEISEKKNSSVFSMQ